MTMAILDKLTKPDYLCIRLVKKHGETGGLDNIEVIWVPRNKVYDDIIHYKTKDGIERKFFVPPESWIWKKKFLGIGPLDIMQIGLYPEIIVMADNAIPLTYKSKLYRSSSIFGEAINEEKVRTWLASSQQKGFYKFMRWMIIILIIALVGVVALERLPDIIKMFSTTKPTGNEPDSIPRIIIYFKELILS